jgi:RecA-family ATPase
VSDAYEDLRQARRRRCEAKGNNPYSRDQPKPNGGTASSEPLPYLARNMPLRDREWLIRERVPMCNVTLLSGDGGVGKTVALMQFAAATVLGKDWLGMRPATGSALYFGAEDDADECRRRFGDIAKHYGATWQDLFDAGLRALSFAGADALLGKPNRDGLIVSTPLLARLRDDAIAFKARLIIIDPAADVFEGKEIDRAQVRQFISLLRAIAIAVDCAVILAAHPSLSGMRESTGLSGSTAWNNSVRARFYLTKPKRSGRDGDDDAPDTGLRVLEVKKNNYGPLTASVPIRWQNGVFVIEAKDAFDQTVADVHAEEVFLRLLRSFSTQGRYVSDKPSSAYAPKLFADDPSVRNLSKRELELAMNRLFTAGRIKVIHEGPPSRRTRKLMELPQTPSEPPSDGVQTPSDDVCTHTPYTPAPSERGTGGLKTPVRRRRSKRTNVRKGARGSSKDQRPERADQIHPKPT